MEIMPDATTVEQQLLEYGRQSRIPVNGSIELLPLCNMNCKMCYVRLSRAEMARQGRLRTAAEWLALGKEMQQAGVLFLLLTGGEPLLYPEFREVYLGLRAMGMVLTVNTNGTLLDEDWADFFAANKPRRINITLYGADAEAYGSLCGYPQGFEKTMAAIRLLKERSVDVRVGCSITKDNLGDIQKIRELAGQLDVPLIMDAYMYPATREREKPFAYQSRLLPEDAASARLFAIRCDIGEEQFPQYIAQSLQKVESFVPDPAQSGIACNAGKCSFAVNWQGKLRPCVISSGPEASAFDLGFREAWCEVSRVCDGITTSEKCALCHLRPLCKNCAVAALAETGSYQGESEYLCRMTREYYRLLKQAQEACHDGTV